MSETGSCHGSGMMVNLLLSREEVEKRRQEADESEKARLMEGWRGMKAKTSGIHGTHPERRATVWDR